MQAAGAQVCGANGIATWASEVALERVQQMHLAPIETCGLAAEFCGRQTAAWEWPRMAENGGKLASGISPVLWRSRKDAGCLAALFFSPSGCKLRRNPTPAGAKLEFQAPNWSEKSIAARSRPSARLGQTPTYCGPAISQKQ